MGRGVGRIFKNTTMNLDNLSQIKNLDKSNMLGSIKALAEQCREAWDDLKGLNLPRTYQQVKNIVVAGMGASPP